MNTCVEQRFALAAVPLASLAVRQPTAVGQTAKLTATPSATLFSVPAAVDGGTGCSADVAQGTSFSRRAVAKPGSVFTGWSESTGACQTDVQDTGCLLTMNSAQNVAAQFSPLNPDAICADTRSTGTHQQDRCPRGL
jgi:hypothetical protein